MGGVRGHLDTTDSCIWRVPTRRRRRERQLRRRAADGVLAMNARDRCRARRARVVEGEIM